jgi:cell division septation protein DedD
MAVTSDQDTEITLGTGRMLLLFFGLVLVCAFFFSIGFAFGKKTMAIPAAANAGSESPATVVRPSAAKNTQPASPSPELTFYKSVEQKTADTSLAPASTPQSTDASKTDANTSSTPAASGTGYYVQVAAVSRQEDADALVEALKKKQYPAFAAANSANDKFFHVQVGPYANLKDAESMRTRLIGDGYNPIVKK